MLTKPAEPSHEAPGEDSSAEPMAPQAVVAHASEEMTKHYTHLSEEYARRTAEILKVLCAVIPVYGNDG